MPLIHRIEDLQFLCFMLVFGIMAVQARGNRTIWFVWASYLLASLVAIIDFSSVQPLPILANCSILTLLILRYAVLTAGFASFTGRSSSLNRASLGVIAVAAGLFVLAKFGVRPATVLALYYAALAFQLLIACLILLDSDEDSTRTPRWLLAFLFFLSLAYRLDQMAFVLSRRTPHDLWLRDEGLFLNSTILGCLLPFAVVWMMNARDHRILLEQSLLDPLTLLLNRRGLAEAAGRKLARYNRHRQNFAVAVADLDHFKSLNDTHGHAFGDEVLAATAQLMRREMRRADIISRSGGEEFVLLLPVTNSAEMQAVLDRVRLLVEQQSLKAPDGLAQRVTVSIGVTNTCSRPALNWAILLNEADAALYEAKQTGRNRLVCSSAGRPLS